MMRVGHIRRAIPEDAPALAALAERTFRDAYSALTSPETMDLHVSRRYGEAMQRAEIEDPALTTLLLELEGEAVAFAQVRAVPRPEKPTPPCVTGPRPIEVWRFYVRKEWHGKGIAQQLMTAARDEAIRRGGETIWLGVWELNPRAMAFYRKCGFEMVGSHRFMFGDEESEDLVMTCAIKNMRI